QSAELAAAHCEDGTMRASSLPDRRRLAPLALLALYGVAAAGDWQRPPEPPEPHVAPAPAPAPGAGAGRRAPPHNAPRRAAAARASLAAAVARCDSLERLKVPVLLARDLPTRRQQAALGVQAAQASLQVAEGDACYAVTYAFLAALYGRVQEENIETARKNL